MVFSVWGVLREEINHGGKMRRGLQQFFLPLRAR